LNTSGNPNVQNWIGPAGSYWADILLQGLGVGAYALALGMMMAAWRALFNRRVLPGLRESFGLLLLVVCSGAFAHVLLWGKGLSYPAGGIAGAIIGDLLQENFARTGAFILAGMLVLLALVLTADGILAGLGLKGLVAIQETARRGQALAVL